MPQLFALEWDAREIRLMVASGKGRQTVIEQAFSIPFETDPTAADSAQRIGKRIAEELDARSLGRGEVVVAVGRNSIELRQLQLPPAPDEDLPDLVRFQATREFNELDDKWLLDFIPIEGTAESPRTVLATAIAPAILAQIETVCGNAGLKMLRLLLRPSEAALLMEGRTSIPRGRVVLLVDPLGGEADLTAVVNGTSVFLRTTRIVSDPPPLQALLAEIRLTMAAASNQLSGRKVESIVLCGDQKPLADLGRAIETELGIHVELFDPFDGVKLGAALAQSPPQHPGRYAPLMGMLLTELKPSKHAVDFLHPRRRAAPPDPRKKWMIAGAAAAALLLVWIIYSRIDHYLTVSAVDALAQQSKAMDDKIANAKKVRANAADIAKWADDDTLWLDRIYKLDKSSPPAQEVVINELSAQTGVKGGPMTIKGYARGFEGIELLQDGVFANGGRMIEKDSREDPTAPPPYTWYFEATVQPEKSDKP